MGFEGLYKLSLIMNMVDNLTGPMEKVKKTTQTATSKLDRLNATFGGMAKTGVVMTGLGTQMEDAMMKPYLATFDTKKAIGELSSLGVQDLQAIEQAAAEFSSTFAGTTKAEFIAAAYDIKSGIASLSDEGIASYTRMAGVTATATKSTIGTMTDLFATGYGIYKDYYGSMSDEEFAAMFSSGIAASVQQFKTTGDGMSDAVKNLGAAATNAQVPLEEQLSVLGMLQATMSGGEAGTKYKAFLRSAVKGGEELGLSFVDANNQMLSMPEIMDKLKGKFGETMDAAEKMELQQAFGDQEAIALIDLMYGKTGDLQNNIISLYGTMGQGETQALKMAEAINNTDPSKYEVVQQKLHNVAEELGNAVSPAINSFLDRAGPAITKTGEWIANNQELCSALMIIVMVLGGFLIVGGTVAAVIGGIGTACVRAATGISNVKTKLQILGPRIKTAGLGVKNFVVGMAGMAKQAVITAAQALPGLIASVWSFTAALLANPVTWIVIGIMALIAGIILLYNKCEWFRNLVNNLGDAIREKLGAAFDFLKSIVGGIAGVLGNIMGAAKKTVAEKLDNMKQAYESHGGGIKGIAAAAVEGVKGFYTAGFTFLDNLTGGKLTEIKNKFSEKLGPVKDVVGNIMGAAKDTAMEKLNNMKQAYESHGGGIKGIAAAAIEGVKGYYTAGFTFLDNLTGGKLSAIKDKFTQGIQNIKDRITSSITWFKKSGKKIMDTFTEGIKSAIAKPVEAVRGGLQKIRNMLPFSDAKTGPLSELTLSGSKVMTTFADGIGQAEAAPADAAERSLLAMGLDSDVSTALKGDHAEKSTATTEKNGQDSSNGDKTTIIEKLYLNVDLKDIDDIRKLKKLVEQIEQYTNGGAEPVLV